jgi:hypothetical protein
VISFERRKCDAGLKDTTTEGISHFRFRGEAELQTYRRKPQLPNRSNLMPKRRGHKRRIANQARCDIAAGNKAAEIPCACELGEEPGQTVFQRMACS